MSAPPSDADVNIRGMTTHRSDADIAAIINALSLVAGRAMHLRMVQGEDFGGHQAEIDAWAHERLWEALDQLEMTEPAIHAQLASSLGATLATLREDIERGVDPLLEE